MTVITSKKRYFIAYTVIFALICAFICVYFKKAGVSFVWYGDGRLQHYKALLYYHDYIREILNSLIVDHSFNIPQWDFNIGEGADILETFSYYVIGDPFSFFAFLCPKTYMHIYYAGAVLARMYFAGLAFSALCFYLGRYRSAQYSYYGVLTGAISYAFCYWAVINILRHPFFLNPMIYLPLLVMGVEMVIRERRWILLTLTTMIAALSNFYFLYMMAIMIAVYCLIRAVVMLRSGKYTLPQTLFDLLRAFAAALLGMGMSAILFLPVIMTVLGDTRTTYGTTYELVYNLLYYSRLPGSLVSSGSTYAMYMGFSAPILLSLMLLVYKKGYRVLKTTALICVIMMLCPVFGQIMNGFSYMSNRWCFAFALIACLSIVVLWEDLMALGGRDARRLLIGLAVYTGVCLLLEYSRVGKAFEAIGLALFVLIVLLPLKSEDLSLSKEKKQWLVIAVTVVSVMLIFYNKYAVSTMDYLADATDVDYLLSINKNETTAVKKRAKKDGVMTEDASGHTVYRADQFFRYSGSGLSLNGNILAHMSSADYYWTLSNPYVSEFRRLMYLTDNSSFNYTGYDDRSTLLTLSGVRYYVSTKKYAPYGFDIEGRKKYTITGDYYTSSLPQEEIKFRVWENEDAQSIATVFDNYIDRAEWDALDFLGKQEALLYGVVLETEDLIAGGTDEKQDAADLSDISDGTTQIDYELQEADEDVVVTDHSFTVTAPDASVTFSVAGLKGTECYIVFEGLKLTATDTYDLYFDDAADPNDLYTEEAWELLPYSERQLARRTDLFAEKVEYGTITVNAKSSGCYAEPEIDELTGEEIANDPFDYEALSSQKYIPVYTEDYNHYSGPADCAINLKYTDDGMATITLTFDTMGIYSFDSMRFYCQSMEGYDEQTEVLDANAPVSTEVETDEVTAVVDADSDKLVMFSIPYSAGWTATVDGEDADLMRADVMYMAVAVSEGQHTIVLTYHNRFVTIGGYITLFSLAIFVIILFWSKKRQRHIGAKQNETPKETDHFNYRQDH